MHLNSREIRKLNVETIFNRRRLWRCCRCCLNCLLLFGRRASLCTFDRLFVRLCRTNYSSINSRRHASLWSTHRIGWEDNGRRGGLMVSELDSGSSDPRSSPARGHCVVFLGKTLNSHSAPLHPGVCVILRLNCGENYPQTLDQRTL